MMTGPSHVGHIWMFPVITGFTVLYCISNLCFSMFYYILEAEEDARNSHLLFTLSVYQYRVEKSNKGQDEGMLYHKLTQCLSVSSGEI